MRDELECPKCRRARPLIEECCVLERHQIAIALGQFRIGLPDRDDVETTSCTNLRDLMEGQGLGLVGRIADVYSNVVELQGISQTHRRTSDGDANPPAFNRRVEL